MCVFVIDAFVLRHGRREEGRVCVGGGKGGMEEKEEGRAITTTLCYGLVTRSSG